MAVVVCPKCGIIVPASKSVCMRCGAPLTPQATPVVESVKPEISVAEPAKTAEPATPHNTEEVKRRADAFNTPIARRYDLEPNPHVSLGWSIVAIIFCWPLAVVSLVLRVLSTKAWKSGNEESAKKLGDYSRYVAMASIVVFIIRFVIGLFFYDIYGIRGVL